jgi:glutamate 5-kinase
LRFAKTTRGRLTVDSGAVNALRAGGTSLLPVGVKSVDGEFAAGDAVEVVCDGELIGKGLVAYSASELRSVSGLKTPEVVELIPGAPDEAIHRDRFVLA